MHPDLEEASRILGATRLQSLRHITAPLLRTSVIATWCFVFVGVMRELSAAIMLFTSETKVISVLIFDLNESGDLGAISVLGLVINYSLVALERQTGRLRWYYQFTPHDLWDWDATQTSVLVDAPWQGKPRKLMLHANRNGFFYVFDRADGTLLLAKQFIKKLTWASGIGPDRRPIKLPNQEPSEAGTKVCPSQDGATNWYSPSYNPATRLYYVQTFEKCSVYTKSDQGPWQSGKTYLGGSQRTAEDPRPERILRAIDIRTGKVKWQWDPALVRGGFEAMGPRPCCGPVNRGVALYDGKVYVGTRRGHLVVLAAAPEQGVRWPGARGVDPLGSGLLDGGRDDPALLVAEQTTLARVRVEPQHADAGTAPQRGGQLPGQQGELLGDANQKITVLLIKGSARAEPADQDADDPVRALRHERQQKRQRRGQPPLGAPGRHELVEDHLRAWCDTGRFPYGPKPQAEVPVATNTSIPVSHDFSGSLRVISA